MTTAQALFDQAYGASRGLRPCPEYLAGALAALRFRLGESIEMRCPYQTGTAQAIAWFAGLDKGHALALDHLAGPKTQPVSSQVTLESLADRLAGIETELANLSKGQARIAEILGARPDQAAPPAGELADYHERMLRLARIDPEAAKRACREHARANRKPTGAVRG